MSKPIPEIALHIIQEYAKIMLPGSLLRLDQKYDVRSLPVGTYTAKVGLQGYKLCIDSNSTKSCVRCWDEKGGTPQERALKAFQLAAHQLEKVWTDDLEGQYPFMASFDDVLANIDTWVEANIHPQRCHDCGQPGATTGHQECAYPQDH